MARSRIIAGKAVIVIEAQELINKTLGKVRSNLHRFANEVGNIGETAFRTGFFGSIASGAIVGSFVKFDDAMRTLRVNLDLFGKSAKQVETVMKPLEDRIRSLAQSTPFAPTEVAQAATELAKGGFEPKQIENALQAVLDLARATNTELGFAAEFVVRTLTTYGVATENAAEVVSQLVRASRKGTLGIEDLEAAMRYSSGTADTLGVSLQKMLAIFTVLSNRGLVGSIAGTSTNTAFSQLVKKAEQLKDLGKIELVTGIRQDGREALDVLATFENLFKFAESLDFTKQQTLFQDIFNLRGARSVSAIRREIDNIKQLSGFIADANDEAREAARIQDAGIGGSLRRLLSTIQDLNIALGQSTEKIIIKIAATIKGLLEELNKLSALNPALTSLIILSPGILLGAGVGLLALSKALRVAAVSVGLLKSAFQPLSRFLTKGTVGQIALLAQIRNRKGPSAAAQAAAAQRRAALIGAGQAIGTGASSTAQGVAGAIRSQRNLGKQIALNTLLTKKYRKELLDAKIIQRRGVANPAPYFAQAAATRQQARAAALSARLSRGARGTALRTALGGAATTGRGLGAGFVSIARSTGVAAKSLLTFLNVTRRFVFSTTGFLTILEGLLLFGDKIPGVSNVLSSFGRGFSNAFKAIGNIAKFTKGPLDLFKASIEAFAAGRADLGVQGLGKAFSSLVSIIGNQLLAAWNRFKASIADTYDFVVNLATVISTTITSVINSIAESIAATFSTQKALINSLTGGALSSSGGLISAASGIAESIALLIPQLFNWLAQLSVTFNEVSQKFLAGLEYTFNNVNPLTDQATNDALFKAQTDNATSEANLRRKRLEIDLKATLDSISAAFRKSSLQTSQRNANQAAGRSTTLAQEAFTFAAAIRQEIAKVVAPQAQARANFNQQITPGNSPLNAPAVQAMKVLVEAMVGSAQSTQRNLLRTGKPIEQKQLEEQQKTNDLLGKIAEDKGLTFAP